MNEKIVVTGGAGFIGSHLVPALSERYSVTILDNFRTARTAEIRNLTRYDDVEVVRGDIRNRSLVRKTLRKASAIFHLAAQTSVPESTCDPIFTNDVNVRGTLNLLMASVERHVSRFVFASSCAVYGDGKSTRQRESDAPDPKSPYAATKLSGENYCKVFSRLHGLVTVSLRIFNVYGPGQRQDQYSGVISTFIKAAGQGRHLMIYGDGRQTRDFVHVQDIVRASLLALESDRVSGTTLNIGTGIPTPINKLANIILGFTDKPRLKPIHKAERLGDIKYSCADTQKARHLLAFTPKVRLADGLQRLVKSDTKIA